LYPGLACHLLGIQSQPGLERSPFLGAIFEGFVAAEILKSQVSHGKRKELYWFRDQQGLEVDFLVPRANARFWAVEVKAAKTVSSSMAGPLMKLERAADGRAIRRVVVHRKARMQTDMTALARGIEALSMERFAEEINAEGA